MNTIDRRNGPINTKVSVLMKDIVQYVDDFDNCDSIVKTALSSPLPNFISRVGGSDADLLIDIYRYRSLLSKTNIIAELGHKISILHRYNGYYDFTNSDENIFRFYNTVLESYSLSQNIFLVGASLLTEFLPNSINEKFKVENADKGPFIRSFILEEVVGNRQVSLLPYSYIERLTLGTTFFNCFKLNTRSQRTYWCLAHLRCL